MAAPYFKTPGQLARYIFAILAIQCVVSPPAAHADESWDVVLGSWIDNLTYSAPNTAFGATAAATSLLGALKNGRKIAIRIDKSRRQVIVTAHAFGPADFSLGGFHLRPSESETDNDDHEAGHSNQASVLGLAYVPFVLINYAVAMDATGNATEKWANAWAKLTESTLKRRKMRARYERGDESGENFDRWTTSLVLIERTSRVDIDQFGEDFESYDWDAIPSRPITLSSRLGEVGASLELRRTADHEPHQAIQLHGSLYEKDFQAEWKVMSSYIRALIDSEQVTGRVNVDFGRDRVDATALRHRIGVGLRLGNRGKLALDAKVRGGYALKGRWAMNDAQDPGFFWTTAKGYELRLHILDRVALFKDEESERGTDGYRRDSSSIGVESRQTFSVNGLTGPDADSQNEKPARVFGRVTRKLETEAFSGAGEPTRIRVWVLEVGGRF